MECNTQNLRKTFDDLVTMRNDALDRNMFGASVGLSQVIAAVYKTIQDLECTMQTEETAKKLIRRRLAPPGECKTCDETRATGNKFVPLHDAHPSCKSGRHLHCTCDTCF